MLSNVFFLACVFFASVTAVFGAALTKEEETLTTFEAVCMVNADHPNVVQNLLPTLGGTEAKDVTVETSLAPLTGRAFKALLGPFTGQTFKLKAQTTDFLVSVTDTGACSIYSRDADGDNVERLLKEHVPNQLLAKNVSKLETHSTYAVSFPADPATLHALIFVDHANSPSAPGIRLSALAEQFLRARRQKSPRWPELPDSPK
jgi:hypothetical protein